MATRDVTLIIRARDEAAATVDKISASLRGLRDIQSDLSKSGSRVDTTLDRLSTALKGLDQSFKNFQGGERLTESLRRSASSVQRLEAEVAQAAQQSNRYSVEARYAADVTKLLAASAERAAAALSQEKGQMAAASQAQARVAAEVNRLVAAKERLARQEQTLTAQIGAQAARVDSARAKYAQLAGAVAAAAAPSNALVNSAIRASNAIATQETRLDGLNAKLSQNRAAQTSVNAILGQWQAELARANVTVQRQSETLAQAASNVAKFKDQTAAAARNQRALDDAALTGEQNLARLRDQLQRANQAYAQQRQVVGQHNAAMSEAANVIRGVLTQAIDRQRQAMAAQRGAFEDAADGVARLRRALESTASPTRQMIEQFDQAVAARNRLKASLDAVTAGLREMIQGLNRAGTDLGKLEGTTQEFISIQQRVANAVKQAGAAAGQASAGHSRLRDETERLQSRQRGLLGFLRELRVAFLGLGGGADGAVANFNRVGNSTRTALTYTQRLVAQVRALIVAYGGIFTIIRGIRGVIDATAQLDRATSRLGVIFEGDTAQATKELDGLRRMADELGLSFGDLADEFTIFASSTLGTNIGMQETRDIFRQVSTAATVAGLSMDDVRGVFKALGQIASKGTLQMEELRGQLGDRMPAALKLMAEGLGISVKELQEQTKQAKISSDALIPFGRELEKRYGKELPAALERLPALMNRFSNAIFQAELRVGRAGFMAEFKRLIKDFIDFLDSSRGDAFFEALGQSLAALTRLLRAAVENIRLVATALATLVAIKAISFFGGLASTILETASVIGMAARAAVAGTVAMRGLAAGAATATVATRGLTAAAVLFSSSNVIGLAVTAIAAGLAFWATRADQATEALNRHRDIVDKTIEAYDRAGASVRAWAEDVRDITPAEVEQNFGEAREQLEKFRAEFNRLANETILRGSRGGLFQTEETREQFDRMRQLTNQFAAGKISVDRFVTAMSNLAQVSSSSGVKDAALSLIEAAREGREAEKVFNDLGGVFEAMSDESVKAFFAVRSEMDQAILKMREFFVAAQTEAAEKGLITPAVENDIVALGRLFERLDEGEIDLAQFQAQAKQLATETGEGFTRNLVEGMNRAGPSQELRARFAQALAGISEEADKLGTNAASALKRITGAAAEAAVATEQAGSAAAKTSEEYKQVSDQLVRQALEAERADRAARGLDTSLQDAALAAELLGAGTPVDEFKQAMQEADAAIAAANNRLDEQIAKSREAAAAARQSAIDMKITGQDVQASAVSAAAIANESLISVGNSAQSTVDKINGLANVLAGLHARIGEAGSALIGVLQNTGLDQFVASALNAFSNLANAIVGAFDDIQSRVSAVLDDLTRRLASLNDQIEAANRALARQTDGTGAKRSGGRIFGRGTGTSDTAGVFRLSRDEFVLRAAAARSLGYNLLDWMNRTGKLPFRGFAEGGSPGLQTSGSIDFARLFKSGPVLRPINLDLGLGRPVLVHAPEQSVADIVSFAREQKSRSGGRMPSWF